MNVPKTGLLVALALAGGVAIGAAGSTIAANPTASPAPSADLWSQMSQMMNGAGMMGQAGMMNGTGMMGAGGPAASFGPGMTNGNGMMGAGGPGASFGAGMMGNLDPAQRDALLKQCGELHDAMHAAASSAPDAAQPSGAPSLHEQHHPNQ